MMCCWRTLKKKKTKNSNPLHYIICYRDYVDVFFHFTVFIIVLDDRRGTSTKSKTGQ